MATATTKQSRKKALERREAIAEIPLALEISAQDQAASRLELLRRRKVARILAKASARDSAGI
jgi:hypothetical protein